METTLIDQGFSLMLYGMGTVFVFLTILVFATTLMSKVVNKLSPEEPAPTQLSPPTSSNTANNTQASPQVIKAIEKAISQHRASK